MAEAGPLSSCLAILFESILKGNSLLVASLLNKVTNYLSTNNAIASTFSLSLDVLSLAFVQNLVNQPVSSLTLDEQQRILACEGGDFERDWTALHAGASLGHSDICLALLHAGATVNAVDADGWAALHVAANDGQAAVCEVLLVNGADSTLRNSQLWTPLRLAADGNHGGACEVLLRLGVSPPPNNDGDLDWLKGLSPSLDSLFSRLRKDMVAQEPHELEQEQRMVENIAARLAAMREENQRLETETRRLLQGLSELETTSCAICFSRRRDCLLLPCMHLNFCEQCINKYEQGGSHDCPLCRRVVEEKRVLFKPNEEETHLRAVIKGVKDTLARREQLSEVT